MIVIDYVDQLDRLSDRELSPADRAVMQRMWAKWRAWVTANPNCGPRIPHYRHVCLDPHCTRQHDLYPPQL